jgi:hypothetical protein
MTDLGSLEERIAIIRGNINELIEQAAAYSGAADEDRSSARIAEQDARLTRLLSERDALLSEFKASAGG